MSENTHSPHRTVVQVVSRDDNRFPQPPIPERNTRPGLPPSQGNRGQGSYYVSLICSGDTVQVLVWPTMSIGELIEDAGSIFGLDPAGISLLLFGMPPVSLQRGSTISGPPPCCSGCISDGIQPPTATSGGPGSYALWASDATISGICWSWKLRLCTSSGCSTSSEFISSEFETVINV